MTLPAAAITASLAAQYEVGELLGEGSCGIVRSARRRLDSQVFVAKAFRDSTNPADILQALCFSKLTRNQTKTPLQNYPPRSCSCASAAAAAA